MTQTAEVRTGTAEPAEWVLCRGCELPVYGARWVRNHRICPECGRYEQLTAVQRLELLCDPGQLEIMDFIVESDDPLGFVDTRPYPQRLAAAKAATGLPEAVVCARVEIQGEPAVVAAMDFRFLGGSLGTAVGELITLAAGVALAEHTPLIIVSASGGARMQEGVLSLMQMAKTSAALAALDEAGVLTISLVTDPTYGGVAASFATLCDVIIAEPGARLGFAGRRVIEQTIRQQLPERFQTAEFLMERGFIDLIVPRAQLRAELAALLRIASWSRRLPAHGPTAGPATGPATGPADGAVAGRQRQRAGAPVIRDPYLLPEPELASVLANARDLTRPTALEYCALAFTDFRELHGDRLSGDCPSVVAGTAWLDDRPVMVIGQQKGHTPAELTARSFGMPGPAGYRKAARLMRLADKLRLPLVTLVDTPGAYPGAEAEEHGQAYAVAENLRLMASLLVPVVTVVLGEGGSGGALALAVGNRVLMCSRAVYSVISPEGCAAILWKDPAAVPRAVDALKLGPRDLLRLGVVDGVIPEPEGGSGADPAAAAANLRRALAESIEALERPGAMNLVEHRRARFRQFGSGTSIDAEFRSIQG